MQYTKENWTDTIKELGHYLINHADDIVGEPIPEIITFKIDVGHNYFADQSDGLGVDLEIKKNTSDILAC